MPLPLPPLVHTGVSAGMIPPLMLPLLSRLGESVSHAHHLLVTSSPSHAFSVLLRTNFIFCSMDRLGISQTSRFCVLFFGFFLAYNPLFVFSLSSLFAVESQEESSCCFYIGLESPSAKFPTSSLAVRGKWYRRGTVCYRIPGMELIQLRGSVQALEDG